MPLNIDEVPGEQKLCKEHLLESARSYTRVDYILGSFDIGGKVIRAVFTRACLNGEV